MAGNSNNITIKLKVDGSEDAVRVVNKVKSSFDEVIKAQADLVKQKAKEIELDGALKRSLDARAKILKEDMQKARIEEFKRMQEVLRTERTISSEIKKRAGEIANAKREANAEVAAKRENLKLTKDILRADKDRTLGNLAILKQEANLRAANHRAEINRIKAEKAARIEAQAASGGGRGDRSTFFAPVIQTIASRVGLSDAAARNASGMLDFLGRANLALLVLGKSVQSVINVGNSLVQSSLAADQFRLKMVSLQIVGNNTGQTFGQLYQTYRRFNDGLQSENALITATRTFATLGISTQQTNQLIDGLRNGIVAMGGDVSEQLPLMALAFKRQESALLDNAGITANLDVMYKEYAKTLGTTVDKLTTQQKVQASIVGSLKELSQYQGLTANRANSLTGAFDRQRAEAERLNRALGVAAMPASTAFVAITNQITRMNIALAGFFALFTGGFSEVVRNPEYQMFLGGRFASAASIGGERTGQGMGLSTVEYQKIADKDLKEEIEKVVKDAETQRDRQLRDFAKELKTSSDRVDEEIIKRIGKADFKRLFDRYKSILRGPEEAARSFIQGYESSDQDSKASAGGTGITVRVPAGRGGVFRTETYGAGRNVIKGITSQQRTEAMENIYDPLRDEALSKILALQDKIDTKQTSAGKQQIKTAKQTYEENLRNLKTTMQAQGTVENIVKIYEKVIKLIRDTASAQNPLISQTAASTEETRASLQAQDLIEASIRRTSQQKNIQFRIEKAGIEQAKYAVYTGDKELDNARSLVQSYKDRAAALNKIKQGTGDELLQSAAYADALENVLRLTERISDANVDAFGEGVKDRLQKMIDAHKSLLVRNPYEEYMSYAEERIRYTNADGTYAVTEGLIHKLKKEKAAITGQDKEAEEKRKKIQQVIDDATVKMNESLKDAFNKTLDIVQAGIEKTFSVISSTLSGNLAESMNIIGQDIFSNVTKTLSSEISQNKDIMKSVLGSHDELEKAVKPFAELISKNIANPIIDGITSGISGLTQMGTIATVGILGAFVAIAVLVAQFVDSFSKMAKISDEIKETTKDYVDYSLPKQFKKERGSIFGLKEMGPVASSELESIEQKKREAEAKSKKLDKDTEDWFFRATAFVTGGVSYAKNRIEKHFSDQEISQLEDQYKKVQEEADKYNDQLSREASLKSSKEMLYDLDQQIAEMNIDNALRMGQITQEEADRQKKLLEIEQKKKELTDQAIDIATGFVDQSVLRKYKDNPQQFQADLSAAVNDFAKTGNTKGLEALGITGEEITGPNGLAKIFEKIGQILAGDKASANMPGSSPDKPMYTQVVNVKDFRLAFPDSAYFRAPSVATTSGGVTTLNGNSTMMR